MTPDEVIQRIKGAPNLAAMSRDSGIPYQTLRNILTGATPDPRKSTLDAARVYFERVDEAAAPPPVEGPGRAAA